MPSNVFPLPSDLLQPHPGLGILRLAALSAEGQGNLDRRMMTLCACDWRGIADRAGQAYAKAAVLETALSACADLDEDLTAAEIGAADPLDALRIARAEAIAEALRSERWSS